MAHFDITKNSIISNVLIGFSFYFLSCLNLFYPNVTFLLLTIFFLISLIVHIFNKARKSLFSDLFFIVINAFITYFHFELHRKFSLQTNGFISGILFMFGNIQINKSIFLTKHKLSKIKRIEKYNEMMKNSQTKQANDCKIIWEEWKD